MEAAAEHHVSLPLDWLGPCNSGRSYLNFAERRVDPRSIFPEEAFDRLRRPSYSSSRSITAKYRRRSSSQEWRATTLAAFAAKLRALAGSL
jgi:hypothetical protein